MARLVGILLLTFVAIAAAQPPYECADDNRIEFEDITATTYPDSYERRLLTDARCSFHPAEENGVREEYQFYYEWEGYDGWYNNPSHPDWGGADMPMERKTPVAYPDGVYEIAGEERGNVLLIANMSQNGITGFPSTTRTGLFIFFGQQVVEEMLDAQRAGCIPEYEDMLVPKCHALYDPDCRGDRYIPFLRNRYDFRTGYNPNNPRMILNEITPWIDGGLMYGVTKAWADALRTLRNGRLVTLDESGDFPPIAGSLPAENTIGLPLANPPPPANHSLFIVNRFWRIGNPRGNENPFLLTMGILWFRVHNWWAEQLRRYGEVRRAVPLTEYAEEEYWEEDEWLYNRARQLTIVTHQHIVFSEWLPQFIPRAFVSNGGELFPYESNPGYSAYFDRSGYNPAINPQIAHIFQSAAMRFGHTIVTPGIWRRQPNENSNVCQFGSPISAEMNGLNSFLQGLIGRDGLTAADVTIDSYDDIIETFYRGFPVAMYPDDQLDTLVSPGTATVIRLVRNSISADARTFNVQGTNFTYRNADNPDGLYFSPRTCNAYWNPQIPIRGTGVDAMYLGMASQAGEREDTIITPDLRGQVFGPLDFSRRDLMAVNLQRAREEGLPDFNSARLAYGLPRLNGFEELNPLYGVHPEVTLSIENLREVYNNDIDLCDIWVCGVAETIPSDYANYIGNQDATFDDLPSGPGELFTAVLFDQFMRIRHGDRFWYENYRENRILTQREFDFINSLTIKRLLVLTTDIRDEDLSDTPFLMDENTVCPQPYQLSELYMDDCVNLQFFDYYTRSTWQIPVIWGLVFLYVALVVMILFLMAAYNQNRRQKILSAGRTQRAKKIEGTDLTNEEGEVLIAWELKAGLKSETRNISMKFGPGKRIVLFSGDTILREIDLRNQTQLTFQRPFDDHAHFVIKIPHEYDVIVRCRSPLDRTVFIDKIQNFLNDIGIGHTLEEPQKRAMIKDVFTKKDRQLLLENFFKSVFREGAQVGVDDIGETRGDILECELTRTEFADAMSLKKDSLFVDQMFTLIDQDGNGFISFREFLDMIVIFAKGSPEDKIKLMFDMYDVDHSGHLDREEFKKMLKAMMEMVNATVSPDQVDQLINSMFTSAGFQNKQELTLEDFNVLLRDHKEELSSAHLNVKGFDVPEVEIEKKAPEGEAAPSRYRARETAPARARRTIIKAYGRTSKGDPRSKQSATASVEEQLTQSTVTEIPVQKRTITQTKLGRQLAIFIRWVENYKLHIFYITLFELVTMAIFVERAYYYAVERENGGLRRIAGYGVTITRGAASGMMWTYSVLLLTMSRNFITFLRETIFNYYVPLDSYISAHKIIALNALIYTIVHGIGHGINFYHIATQTANDLTCIFRDVYHRSHTLPKFTYWLFLSMTGFSAFILTLVTVVMFVFATQYARRYTFQAFWFTHHWYVVFYILAFLHGSGRLVQNPLFGNFFLGPAIVFAIDQLISVSRRKSEVAVVRADILPSQVIGICFKRPTTFDYKAGQWVRIASLAQNPGEFHPFTLSSAPNEEHLSLHIRAVGPWTHNFRENYNPANLRGQPYPKLYLDGPFGEGHQDWFRFEVSILVGGGIGVTPFASILKELVHRFNIGARVQCKKVFFIWVARSQKQYEWFTDIIREVEEADKKGLVEIHIFITQFFDKFDLRTTMLYICERHFQKLSGRSLFTGLRSVTHFGRPDFKSFFDNLQEEYIQLPKIGVFSCGPPGMTNGVEDACAATNRFEGPAFLHHFENF